MDKPQKLTTQQYVGLVRNLNSRMAQMSLLFNDNQQSDKSEIVDSLANKAPRTHKSTMISQGINPKTGDLATFVENRKRDKTTDNIDLSNIPASDSDRDTTNNKNRFQED